MHLTRVSAATQKDREDNRGETPGWKGHKSQTLLAEEIAEKKRKDVGKLKRKLKR